MKSEINDKPMMFGGISRELLLKEIKNLIDEGKNAKKSQKPKRSYAKKLEAVKIYRSKASIM